MHVLCLGQSPAHHKPKSNGNVFQSLKIENRNYVVEIYHGLSYGEHCILLKFEKFVYTVLLCCDDIIDSSTYL